MSDVKPEADAQEQETPVVVDDDEFERETVLLIGADVPEADAIEQAQTVPGGLDDDMRS